MARLRPCMGIGFGQRGYWGNQHYSSESLARAAYAQQIEQTIAAYARMRYGYVVEPIPFVAPDSNLHVLGLLEGVRIINRLKSGKIGHIVHSIHLYAIPPEMADHFMADAWYAVNA